MYSIIYRILFYILRFVVFLYFRFSVLGRENIPRHGAAILISNHASFLDPPLLALAIPRQVKFMAMQGVFNAPVIGVLAKFFNAFQVDLSKSFDMSAFRKSINVLKEGGLLGIFPEGTRNNGIELLPFKPGVGLLALKTRAILIPVAITGSGRAFPQSAIFPRPFKITITIGKPMDYSEFCPSDSPGEAAKIAEYARKEVESLINERKMKS